MRDEEQNAQEDDEDSQDEDFVSPAQQIEEAKSDEDMNDQEAENEWRNQWVRGMQSSSHEESNDY